MKNLSQRSKILLAIAGIVVVVIAAGVAILGPTGTGLFGATISSLSPSTATVGVGQKVAFTSTLSVVVGTCTWTSSNPAVARVSGYNNFGEVTGIAAGQATITESCVYGAYQFTADVTVKAAPTITVGPDTGKTSTRLGNYEKMTLCTGDSSVQ